MPDLVEKGWELSAPLPSLHHRHRCQQGSLGTEEAGACRGPTQPGAQPRSVRVGSSSLGTTPSPGRSQLILILNYGISAAGPAGPRMRRACAGPTASLGAVVFPPCLPPPFVGPHRQRCCLSSCLSPLQGMGVVTGRASEETQNPSQGQPPTAPRLLGWQALWLGVAGREGTVGWSSLAAALSVSTKSILLPQNGPEDPNEVTAGAGTRAGREE